MEFSTYIFLSFLRQVEEQNDIDNLRIKLEEISQLHDATENELQSLKSDYKDLLSEKVGLIYG